MEIKIRMQIAYIVMYEGEYRKMYETLQSPENIHYVIDDAGVMVPQTREQGEERIEYAYQKLAKPQ